MARIISHVRPVIGIPFPNQTAHNCPICCDPIFNDADVAEFEDFRGYLMHAVCLEARGTDAATKDIEYAITGDAERRGKTQ